MITPANFLTNNYLAAFRRFLIDQSEIDHIVVIDGGVFRGVSVDNAVFVVAVGAFASQPFPFHRAEPQIDHMEFVSHTLISPEGIRSSEHLLFTGSEDVQLTRLWDRICARSTKLGKVAHVNFGKQLRDRKEYPQDVVKVDAIKDLPVGYVPCYTGRDVSRYSVKWNRLGCLNDRQAKRGGCWDDDRHIARNKILTRQVGRHPEFALDASGYHCLNTMFMINLHDSNLGPMALLGLLNSRLIRAFWLDKYYDQRRTFPKIKGTYLKLLPIRTIDFNDAQDVSRRDRMVDLVERMLSLHKQLDAAKTPTDKTAIQRQIGAMDKQIDNLVYELYDLTNDEITIVEEGTRQ